MYKVSLAMCLSLFVTFTICYVVLFALYSLINYLYNKIVVNILE
jgi:hypothetical protein